MNRSLVKRNMARLLVWSGVVVLSAVVALAQDSAAVGSQRTDGQIEMDVVHALDGSQALKNDLITAATIQGEVTLAGTVSTGASKKLAESIVAKVPGVSKVNNNLTVGNPQDALNAAGVPADETGPDPQQQASAPADNGPGAQAAPQQYPNQDPNQAQYPQQAPQQYPQQAPPQDQQNQYPQQGQYPPPPSGRPQYAPNQPQGGYPQPAPAYRFASQPVTIPQGTLLQLRTNEPVASKRAKDGEPVQFTVIGDVTYGGVLAIPRGATVHGVISESKNTNSGNWPATRCSRLRSPRSTWVGKTIRSPPTIPGKGAEQSRPDVEQRGGGRDDRDDHRLRGGPWSRLRHWRRSWRHGGYGCLRGFSPGRVSGFPPRRWSRSTRCADYVNPGDPQEAARLRRDFIPAGRRFIAAAPIAPTDPAGLLSPLRIMRIPRSTTGRISWPEGFTTGGNSDSPPQSAMGILLAGCPLC